MTAPQTIGFIGLGAMGHAMAGNLLRAGFEVVGHDASMAAMESMRAAGGRTGETPRAAAEAAGLVITMLPNAPDVDAVLEGAEGMLAAPAEGRLLMNCSTIAPAEARRLAAKAAAAGWAYLDCAVGRTATQAAEGKCLFLLGGEAAHKAAVRPALDAMGDTVIDCGGIGQASALKIVNNYLALVSCLATAEALQLARSAEVPPELALEVINGTTARNGNTQLNFPNKVLKGDVSPGFPLVHGLKDLGIAVQAMETAGLRCFLGKRALNAFEAALQLGHGPNDCTDILNALNALSEMQDAGETP